MYHLFHICLLISLHDCFYFCHTVIIMFIFRRRKEVFSLSRLAAYIIIPFFTILFAQNSNWFTSNFSVIGSQIGRQEEFILWGLIVGIYFFWCLQRILASFAVSNGPKPKGACPLLLALTLLTLAVTTPYLPQRLPFISFLHVIFAFCSAVCLILSLFLTIWSLYQKDPKQYRPFLVSLAGIVLCSMLLLWLCGIVSSALEIFFTISSAVLVQRLYEKVCPA